MLKNCGLMVHKVRTIDDRENLVAITCQFKMVSSTVGDRGFGEFVAYL
jgi:hypothetical protein